MTQHNFPNSMKAKFFFIFAALALVFSCTKIDDESEKGNKTEDDSGEVIVTSSFTAIAITVNGFTYVTYADELSIFKERGIEFTSGCEAKVFDQYVNWFLSEERHDLVLSIKDKSGTWSSYDGKNAYLEYLNANQTDFSGVIVCETLTKRANVASGLEAAQVTKAKKKYEIEVDGFGKTTEPKIIDFSKNPSGIDFYCTDDYDVHLTNYLVWLLDNETRDFKFRILDAGSGSEVSAYKATQGKCVEFSQADYSEDDYPGVGYGVHVALTYGSFSR